jgi:hypothetical protein
MFLVLHKFLSFQIKFWKLTIYVDCLKSWGIQQYFSNRRLPSKSAKFSSSRAKYIEEFQYNRLQDTPKRQPFDMTNQVQIEFCSKSTGVPLAS